jgi:hypothetical protein
MSSTTLLPPRAQLCIRYCSNKHTHTLVRDGQTSPHRLRLVVSRSTCPPSSPPPPVNTFVIGTTVRNKPELITQTLRGEACILATGQRGTRVRTYVEINNFTRKAVGFSPVQKWNHDEPGVYVLTALQITSLSKLILKITRQSW